MLQIVKFLSAHGPRHTAWLLLLTLGATLHCRLLEAYRPQIQCVVNSDCASNAVCAAGQCVASRGEAQRLWARASGVSGATLPTDMWADVDAAGRVTLLEQESTLLEAFVRNSDSNALMPGQLLIQNVDAPPPGLEAFEPWLLEMSGRISFKIPAGSYRWYFLPATDGRLSDNRLPPLALGLLPTASSLIPRAEKFYPSTAALLRVIGQLQDDLGQPVANADVHLQMVEDPLLSTPSVRTDALGAFILRTTIRKGALQIVAALEKSESVGGMAVTTQLRVRFPLRVNATFQQLQEGLKIGPLKLPALQESAPLQGALEVESPQPEPWVADEGTLLRAEYQDETPLTSSSAPTPKPPRPASHCRSSGLWQERRATASASHPPRLLVMARRRHGSRRLKRWRRFARRVCPCACRGEYASPHMMAAPCLRLRACFTIKAAPPCGNMRCRKAIRSRWRPMSIRGPR